MKFLLIALLISLLCSFSSVYNIQGKITSVASTHQDTIPLTDTVPNINDTVHIDSIPLKDTLHADTITYCKTLCGIASFYSLNLDGTRTSTGEIFRHKKMTAASNNFKLNTWVKVTNLSNGKVVIVRINDHMHKRMEKKGRVVDLSRTAAKALDFMKAGLTKVKVEELPGPVSMQNTSHAN